MRYGIGLLAILMALAALPACAYDQRALDNELVYRVRFGRYDDIRLLLAGGANPNTITSQGDPVLSLAVTRHDDEAAKIVRMLLDAGADANAKDRTDVPPILAAATGGQKQMIEDLLAHGADYHVKDADGTELVEVARNSAHPDAAQPIQIALDAWRKYNDSRNSPGRYESLLRRYSVYSCMYQYWDYVLLSGQDKDHESQTKQTMEQTGTEVSNLVREIQTYYPATKRYFLQDLSTQAQAKIRADLDDLISNRNRAGHGVGTQGDDYKRCTVIADGFALSFTPPK